MSELTLPWPPKELNPNHKCHWGKKNRAVKKYRESCTFWAILELNKARKMFPDDGRPISFDITFIPPDRRKRDDDNMESAFKAGRDAIAAAWGINDFRFRVTKRVAEEPIKHGLIVVKVAPLMAGL